VSETFFEIDLKLSLKSFELDYQLATNERYVGVYGPSGAGKTTVIECLAGWRHPQQGFIRIGDHVLYDSSRGINVEPSKRGIGYVAQDILLFPHWDVMRNVTAGAGRKAGGVQGKASTVNQALVERVLDSLELTELAQRPVDHLSGGERHRVALARALCSEPDLLLLDEPLSSLDVRLKRRILGDLVRVHEEFDVPMLLISHDPVEVQVLCNFAQFVRSGKVEDEGLPANIVSLGTAAEHENILRGVVTRRQDDVVHVQLGEGRFAVLPHAELQVGDRVVLGVRANEILIANSKPQGLSARNVFLARIDSVQASGVSMMIRARLGEEETPGSLLMVNLTQESYKRLELAVGAAVYLIIKSHSIEVFASM